MSGALFTTPVDIALLPSAAAPAITVVPPLDFAVADGDLATDSGLRTAVLLSLLTRRRAAADDALPYPTRPPVSGSGSLPDRGGWWADAPVGGAAPPSDPADPALSGSRLWLRVRSLATPGTLRAVEHDVTEALAWMTQRPPSGGPSLATRVEAAATAPAEDPARVTVALTITRADGTTWSDGFAPYWDGM